jgi:O-antigen/teichoic acid export membrane protein
VKVAHIAWNVGGMSVPLLVAAATVPALIETLGNEKFGLLALAWGVIGYAGALDLGLGRALTGMLARLDARGEHVKVGQAFATTARLTLIAGSVAGCCIALAAYFDAFHWIKVSGTSAEEMHFTILLLAIALPAQAMSATYKGVNEAYLNFKGINILRALLGVINFAGPWLIAQWTSYLPWVVSSIVVSRLAALVVYRSLAMSCIQCAIAGSNPARYSNDFAKQLLSFGGWVTVSSVVGPLLVQMDRFVIAGLISAAAVGVYVLPYELVTRCLILAGAVSSVMYPKLARLIQEQPQDLWTYVTKWVCRIIRLMAFVSIVLALTLPYLLPLWIKSSLDPASVVVGQILCIGVFFNAIGVVYYAALHAAGRADITAKIHVIELPLYLMLLFTFIEMFGVVGAAWAWVVRVVLDTGLLFVASRR